MKVTILKKMIKEGVSNRTGNPYKIRNLFVKFEEKPIYDRIIKELEKAGADRDMIDRALQESEYEGKTNYTFFINCSSFTFDRVHRFGILDIGLDYTINDQGFINFKIKVVEDKYRRTIEDVRSYKAPEVITNEEVEGWAIDAPDPITEEQTEPSEMKAEPTRDVGDIPQAPEPQEVDDLPF